VDAVMMFDVLYHLERADRKALFQKLFTQYLTPNGVVIIITRSYAHDYGFVRLMERLGKPAKVYYEEAVKEMLQAGFRLEYKQDIEGPEDLSNPGEDLVKYIQLLTDNEATVQEVRTAIDDVYGSVPCRIYKKMAIFKKQPNK